MILYSTSKIMTKLFKLHIKFAGNSSLLVESYSDVRKDEFVKFA